MASLLDQLFDAHGVQLSSVTKEKIVRFYELMLQENQIQNLTRLTSPEDFYYGNVCDVLELLKSGFMNYPAADLGSGGGIPGLLCALVESSQWVLVESEKKKAEYLQKVVDTLLLSNHVQVAPERIEHYLKGYSVQSIVARAVGPVDRIYSWVRACSTWNNLILLKGPSWEEEWAKFGRTKYRNELKIESEHYYEVGPELKRRKIIKLVRVPRGTK